MIATFLTLHSWQDVVLTVVSVVFSVALVPAIRRRSVPPLKSCVQTAAGLYVIAGVYLTLHPVIIYSALSTCVTALLWTWCAAIARQQESGRAE